MRGRVTKKRPATGVAGLEGCKRSERERELLGGRVCARTALELKLLVGVGNHLRDCLLTILLAVVTSNRDRMGISSYEQQ
jgi:hypothetical protein